MRKIFLLCVFVCAPLVLHADNDALRRLARDFGKKLQPLHKPRVALLPFPYHNGKISSGSSILCERLTTYMAETKKVRVIERNLIKKLLEEQHLSETGVVDASAAQKIGKVVGVDVIITGTLNDFGENETELNARALEAASGEVVAAGRVVVEREWQDRPRSPKPIAPIVVQEDEDEERAVPNEAIEIGFPGGRGGPAPRRGR